MSNIWEKCLGRALAEKRWAFYLSATPSSLPLLPAQVAPRAWRRGLLNQDAKCKAGIVLSSPQGGGRKVVEEGLGGRNLLAPINKGGSFCSHPGLPPCWLGPGTTWWRKQPGWREGAHCGTISWGWGSPAETRQILFLTKRFRKEVRQTWSIGGPVPRDQRPRLSQSVGSSCIWHPERGSSLTPPHPTLSV